jgi:hypothetical protein
VPLCASDKFNHILVRDHKALSTVTGGLKLPKKPPDLSQSQVHVRLQFQLIVLAKQGAACVLGRGHISFFYVLFHKFAQRFNKPVQWLFVQQ